MLFGMGMCKVSIARHNLLFLHEMLVNCWWHNRAIIHNIHLLSLCGGTINVGDPIYRCRTWKDTITLTTMEYTASWKNTTPKILTCAMCKDCKRCYHKKNLSCEQLPPETPKKLKKILLISISKLHPTQKQHKINKPEIKGTITRLPNFPTS